jgi:secreted trypsin-like serine protease
MRRRWRRTEEVSSEAATTSWSNGGFLVDRLLCLGTFCGTICCTYVRTAAHPIPTRIVPVYVLYYCT